MISAEVCLKRAPSSSLHAAGPTASSALQSAVPLSPVKLGPFSEGLVGIAASGKPADQAVPDSTSMGAQQPEQQQVANGQDWSAANTSEAQQAAQAKPAQQTPPAQSGSASQPSSEKPAPAEAPSQAAHVQPEAATTDTTVEASSPPATTEALPSALDRAHAHPSASDTHLHTQPLSPQDAPTAEPGPTASSPANVESPVKLMPQSAAPSATAALDSASLDTAADLHTPAKPVPLVTALSADQLRAILSSAGLQPVAAGSQLPTAGAIAPSAVHAFTPPQVAAVPMSVSAQLETAAAVTGAATTASPPPLPGKSAATHAAAPSATPAAVSTAATLSTSVVRPVTGAAGYGSTAPKAVTTTAVVSAPTAPSMSAAPVPSVAAPSAPSLAASPASSALALPPPPPVVHPPSSVAAPPAPSLAASPASSALPLPPVVHPPSSVAAAATRPVEDARPPWLDIPFMASDPSLFSPLVKAAQKPASGTGTDPAQGKIRKKRKRDQHPPAAEDLAASLPESAAKAPLLPQAAPEETVGMAPKDKSNQQLCPSRHPPAYPASPAVSTPHPVFSGAPPLQPPPTYAEAKRARTHSSSASADLLIMQQVHAFSPVPAVGDRAVVAWLKTVKSLVHDPKQKFSLRNAVQAIGEFAIGCEHEAEIFLGDVHAHADKHAQVCHLTAVVGRRTCKTEVAAAGNNQEL